MKRFKLFAVLILLLAILIRLPLFGQIPDGLNRDEAALGYNAYSILKTGQDEFGKWLPISFTSFGDQKLPGYIYTLVPFISILGLNEISVRLPSALAGIIVVGLIGRISWQISPKLIPEKFRLHFTLISMLFVAIAPWANHFSRVAYEANLAMAFFLLGIVFWLEGARNHSARGVWIVLTSIVFSLSLLTYHSYHVLTPLTIIGLVAIDHQQLRRVNPKSLLGSLAIVGFTILVMWWGGVWEANQTKFSGLSPFEDQQIDKKVFEYRQTIPTELWIERIVSNSIIEKVSIFSRNLVEAPSTNFLFTSTTSHRVHNQSGIGNLHLFIAPLLFFGLVHLWNQRAQKQSQLVILWLIASLVAPTLTISPQHTIRISPAFPALELIAAIGMITTYASLTKYQFAKYVMVASFMFIILLSTIRYQSQYLIAAPQRDVTHAHRRWHQLAKALLRHGLESDLVITQSPSSSPYIWYAFENLIPPQEIQANIQRYEPDEEGFIHVYQLNNVRFETIVWDDVFEIAQSEKIRLVLTPSELSPDKPSDPRIHIIETLYNQRGETEWLVVEVKS